MAGELSNLARELLVRERGRQEDESLKARAMERARAAVERPSGIGYRQARSLALHLQLSDGPQFGEKMELQLCAR